VTPDVVGAMWSIAQRFLAQAAQFDERLEVAVELNASSADILALKSQGNQDRLRALSALQALAPYVQPRLSAVEVSPASQSTAERFQQRVTEMDEQQILAHLKLIADGATVEIIEDAVFSEDRGGSPEISGDPLRYLTSAADEPE